MQEEMSCCWFLGAARCVGCGWEDIHRSSATTAGPESMDPLADGNLSAALNKETSTPTTSCWHKDPDSLRRHQRDPMRLRGSRFTATVAAGQEWRGARLLTHLLVCVLEADRLLPTCTPGECCVCPVLQTRLSLDKPAIFHCPVI